MLASWDAPATGSGLGVAAGPRRLTQERLRVGGGLTRRMVIASGLLALVVGAAFAMLLISVIELRAQERRTARSQQVLITANELERLVVDLETGVRGYAITGQERFLAPWRTPRRPCRR
jgi:CHASE3 domain sensor protein